MNNIVKKMTNKSSSFKIKNNNKLHSSSSSIDVNTDVTNKNSIERLEWNDNGYKTWKWKDHVINYLEMGDKSKPAILLIHGFGASAYHWRHNVPTLAQDYHVFAFDMLGFGLSSKPIQDYDAEVWRDQTLDFIQEIVKKPIAVAGNSLGGFTALYAAASPIARSKNLINGVALLNAAGRFFDPNAPPKEEPPAWREAIVAAFQRFVIGLSFIYTKQPARIEQVLRQVYPVNQDNVDSDLVKSIQIPAQDPNAAEVFYRVVSRNGNGPPIFVDDLLKTLSIPLWLIWGEEDPWIRPASADKFQKLYPNARRISIDAGHCPMDEAPLEVNKALQDFLASLD